MIGTQFAQGNGMGAGLSPDLAQGQVMLRINGSLVVAQEFKYLRHKMQAEASE
jgi:hypothetical protein